MDFTKYKCAVCNKDFNKDDDIVVCPDCGTPHHRECWKQVGECINSFKHNSKEPVEILKAEAEPEKTDAEKGVFNGEFQGETIPENKNLPLNEQDVRNFLNELRTDGIKPDTEICDGCTVSEYEAVVGKNLNSYIPNFMFEAKTKKGARWNIPAFFVPFAWSVYRKMYGFAAIILAVYIAVFGIISYPILSNTELMEQSQICFEKDPEFMYDVYNYLATEEGSLTPEQTKFVDLLSKSSLPKALSITISLAEYVLRIVYAMFANHLYFKRCTEKIKKAKSIGIPKEQLNSYLHRKYATKTIVVAAVIGIFELWYFIIL